jgi:hypothetical protein
MEPEDIIDAVTEATKADRHFDLPGEARRAEARLRAMPPEHHGPAARILMKDIHEAAEKLKSMAYTHTAFTTPDAEAAITEAIEGIENAHVRIMTSPHVPAGTVYMCNEEVLEQILRSAFVEGSYIHESYRPLLGDRAEHLIEAALWRAANGSRVIKLSGLA